MKKYQQFIRAFKDIFKISGNYYIWFIMQSFIEVSIPFVNFLYMSRVLAALTQERYEQVSQLIIQYLVIFAVMQIILAILSPRVRTYREMINYQIRQEPAKKMMNLQFVHADANKTHELLHQVNRDMITTNSSILNISHHIDAFIKAVMTVTWAVILILPLFTSDTQFNEQWQWFGTAWPNVILFALIILTAILQMYLVKRYMSVLDQDSEEIRIANGVYYHVINQMLNPESGKEIRLYNLAGKMREIYLQSNRYIKDWFTRFTSGVLISESVVTVMSQIIVTYLYALIAIKVLFGGLAVSLIIQLSGALSQMITGLNQGLVFITVFSQVDAIERYYQLMDLPDEKVVGSLPVEKRLDADYQLSVENMSFTFPESKEETLHEITQSFEAGKKYAIVGENGSGKTTFIKLLMRLYEPTKGSIQLNQIDANKYKLSEYYQLFSVVFQDFRLLALSLGENVAVDPNYDEHRVKSIIDEVGMHDFIPKLKNGLDTYLGTEYEEDGVNVSGGQAQKIAMARAIYKDAKVMILDEPTAALDPVAEFEIYQHFDSIVKGKTAFYISHRLSSCRFCDEILVFDDGRIIQRGNHQTLVKQEGKYQDLWQAQAQYYA